MKDTIYRFKLDTETGKIERFEITDYDIKYDIQGKKYYKYKLGSCRNFVYHKKMDTVKNNAIYTFNPWINYRELMYEAFMKKANKAYDDYIKYSKIMKIVEIGG